MDNQELPELHSTDLTPGVRVLVIGLGRFGGGVGVTRWLVEQGVKVTVTDSASATSLSQSVDALYGLGVTFRLGQHNVRDLDDVDLVVVNPAVVKSRSDMFQEIQRRGIEWTTELNLFCQRCRARVIGVTGSYGKSTTCAMLAHVLEECLAGGEVSYTGVHLGGNFGGSLLGRLSRIAPSDIVVLEMSNAQLEDIPRIEWAPELAVICNLSPHHLDRYGSYAGYLEAKMNILGSSRRPQHVIVGAVDSAAERAVQDTLDGSGVSVTSVAPVDAPLLLRIPGSHNQSNAACVRSVCAYLDLNGDAVVEALRTFGGLPHRLEHVRTVDGVNYFNDSKATAPSATQMAVEALDRRVIAIVGGQDKGASLEECARALTRQCAAVICIGESGPAFARALESAGADSIRSADDIQSAVRLAREIATEGDAVLFSPGAPSFDAFDNYAHRGAVFIEAVASLGQS